MLFWGFWLQQERRLLFSSAESEYNNPCQFAPSGAGRATLAAAQGRDTSKPISLSALNNEVFVEDIDPDETYSLNELASKLAPLDGKEYGVFEKTEKLRNAYIYHKDLKLKLSGYRVEYSISKPINEPIETGFSKELIGVVEHYKKALKNRYFEMVLLDKKIMKRYARKPMLNKRSLFMKVNTESNHLYTTQRAQASTAAGTNPASFTSALPAATAESSTVKQADFTSMMRKEMFDWTNDQIRSGKMSLDEGSPFLGMTMKISVASGQPVDMATDTTRINFVEKACLGIEGALLNNVPDLAKKLQATIEIMRKQQGQALGVDTRA